MTSRHPAYDKALVQGSRTTPDTSGPFCAGSLVDLKTDPGQPQAWAGTALICWECTLCGLIGNSVDVRHRPLLKTVPEPVLLPPLSPDQA